MVNADTVVGRTRTFRLLSRCLAALMMFAQLSAAAAICPDYAAGASGGQEACAHQASQRQGTNDQMCASEFVPANQIAAVNPVVEVPDMPFVLAAAALWPPAPSVRTPRPLRDAGSFALIPKFLVFGRMLR